MLLNKHIKECEQMLSIWIDVSETRVGGTLFHLETNDLRKS